MRDNQQQESAQPPRTVARRVRREGSGNPHRTLSGDFASEDDRVQYARMIAKRLNEGEK